MTHILKLLKNRTTEIFPLTLSMKKEGERAVDQMEFSCRKSDEMEVNDRIEVVFDLIPVEGLSLFLGFQGGVKDESLKLNHGTATSVTYQSESAFYGKEAIFNGSSSFVSVADSSDFDLNGVFDIVFWAKWSSTTEQYILSKRSANNNGFALSVNSSTAGDVKFHIGSNTLTSSSSGFNDGNKHLIRVTRNSSNLITLYIDNTSVGTLTSSYDTSNTESLFIGKDLGSNFFAGSLLRLRVYKGEALTDLSASTLYTEINPRSILKFGGYITKVDLELSGKKVTCQSYGKILAEKDVRGQAYTNQTVEYILEDLITANTSFSFNDRDVPTGLTINNFIADGKLLDLVSDFASFSNRIFYTTPNEEFFFEPLNLNDTGKTYTHGSGGVLVSKTALDDSKLVNSVTLIGAVSTYDTSETFSGNGVATTFTLLHSARSMKVLVNSVEKSPNGVDYSSDTLNKTITFNVAPSGTIVVEYSYDDPLTIKGEKPSSIATYGVHSKKFNLSWITNRNDGVRFVTSYINRYSTINQNINLAFGNAVLYLNENDVVNVVNSFLGLNSGFVVKSIEWVYPKMNTNITVGEYRFDFFESDKEIVRKLHDSESSITKAKELLDYEAMEEVLALSDIVIQYVYDSFTETLAMTDTKTIYDKPTNTYNNATYGSRRNNATNGNTGSVYATV